MRRFCLFLLFALPLSLSLFPAPATAQTGQTYYDMAVYAYENASFSQARDYVQQAIAVEPDNPYYHHLLGRIYLGLEQYKDARTQLFRTQAYDPNLPGLTYDLGLAGFHSGDYAMAAQNMTEAAEQSPDQVLAHYYAGISYYHLGRYDKAISHLDPAAAKSDSLLASAVYFKGLCYYQTGKRQSAIEAFQFVIKTAQDMDLKASAEQWAKALAKQADTPRRLSLYLKAGGQYDDNVRLDPVDEDLGEEEDDVLFEGFFSASYRFLDNTPWQMGLGLTQYQTLHEDLDDYDLTATIGNLYARYFRSPFLFSLDYLPNYYWVSGDSFLMRHQIKPAIACRINERLLTRLSYNFYTNNHFEDSGRDGETHVLLLDGYVDPLYRHVMLFSQLGLEYNSADRDDETYEAAQARLGLKFDCPWDIEASVSGTYRYKDYRHTDRLYGKHREDDKIKGQVSIVRPLFYDWLNLWLEYDYTDNDSNIDEFSYERHMVTLSCAVSY